MTVRYLHIRQSGQIPGSVENTGGATIAYVEIDGCICLAPAWCSDDDNFDRSIGRKVAAERLKTDGPYDIIEAGHPRSKVIADWAALNLYSEPVNIEFFNKHWVIVE